MLDLNCKALVLLVVLKRPKQSGHAGRWSTLQTPGLPALPAKEVDVFTGDTTNHNPHYQLHS